MGGPCLFPFTAYSEHRFQTVLELAVNIQVSVLSGGPEVPKQDPELGPPFGGLTSRPVSFHYRPLVSPVPMGMSTHARPQLPLGLKKGKGESSSPKP